MPAGQPTKYKKEYCKVAKKMCELGATDEDVSEALGIHIATLYRWRAAHSEFCESLKAGKAPADERVEASLYKRAVGYYSDNVKIFNNQGEALEVPYREYIHPDTTACIFWLKNRMPEQYREKPEGGGSEDMASAVNKLIDKLPN